jgi:hypothetical protein
LCWKALGNGLVVGEDGEVARFQHMAEMLYVFVDGKQLAIVSALLLLGRIEFFREGEWLPGVLDVLL